MEIAFNKQNEIKKVTSGRELAEYIVEKFNGTNEMTDEEKAEKDARIIAKLKMGHKLTNEEMNYLKKTNPAMYAHALRVQRMAEAIEEQLKHARSKEEADRIVSTAMTTVSKDDPDREYLHAAINRISKEMHQSPAYNRLPNTDADAKKARDKQSDMSFKTAEDDSEDKIDLANWSPLQEVIDSMPTFSTGA